MDGGPDEPQEARAPVNSVASNEPVEAETAVAPGSVKPAAMPRPDRIDDLKRISGIGPKLETGPSRSGNLDL